MTDELLATVGRNLVKIRVERGLSQEKIADQIGFDRTYLGDLERGKRNLTLRAVEDLAERLGVAALDLLIE